MEGVAGMSVESLTDRNVLVTGAAGFIGSHLVDALVARGAGVYALVIDHDPLQPLWLSDSIHRVQGKHNRSGQDYLPVSKRRLRAAGKTG